MAHKKGVGSSKNGRESHGKRLGIKIFGGQEAIAGNVIVRQRGTAFHPVKMLALARTIPFSLWLTEKLYSQQKNETGAM